MLQSKWIRYLCCVFVLPLALVVSSPGAAVAADSEVQTFNLDASWVDNMSGGTDAECTVTLAMGQVAGSGVVIVGASSSCHAGPDFSPSWCAGFEYQCSTYSLEIIGEGGLSCGGDRGLASGKGSNDGMADVHTALGPGEFTVGSCDPVEICLTAHVSGNDVTDCNATTLDPVEVPDEVCPASAGETIGTPQIIKKEVVPEGASWRARIYFHGSLPVGRPEGMAWKFYYLVDPGPVQGGDTIVTQSGINRPYRSQTYNRPPGSVPAFDYVTESGLMASETDAYGWIAQQTVIGLGVYEIYPGSNPASLEAVPRTLPSVANQEGSVGITDPSKCAFYWGTKIAYKADPNDTTDEPIGPVVDTGEDVLPDPEPIPDPVGDDPDTGNWWDFLGPLFERLIDAVGDVARALADVVQAVMDGLMALLIPDPASWGIDELVDQLQNKPPFSLLEPLAEEAFAIGDSIGAAGDCGSLADFSGGGIPIHVDCSDVRNAPGMDALYQLVKVGLLACTGLYIFRMFSELLQEGQ